MEQSRNDQNYFILLSCKFHLLLHALSYHRVLYFFVIKVWVVLEPTSSVSLCLFHDMSLLCHACHFGSVNMPVMFIRGLVSFGAQ
jgi:hypothetical protein